MLICTGIYIAEQIYAAAAMWHSSDFSCLGTMLEQCSDIMRTCVFGYLVKAGIENALKIWSGDRKGADEEDPNNERRFDSDDYLDSGSCG